MKRTKKRAVVALVTLLVVAGVGAGAVAVTFDAPVQGSVPVAAPDGPQVTLEGSTDAALSSPIPDSNTVNWTTAAGNATFSSNGLTEATVAVEDLEGTWTNVTSIDATSADLTVTPGDKPAVTVGGQVTDVAFRDTSLDDDVVAVTYSANGNGQLALDGFAGSQEWTAITTSGTVVDSGTTTSGGEATVSVSSGTNEELILFTNHAPEANNLSPSNGTQVTETTVDFSVDVNDSEFPTAQGDEVTAELFVDGSSAGSETVTSNQTVTIQEDFTDGGSHDYYWELTDSYGATTTTSTRTIASPSDLYIRSETNPSELVDDAQVNITYYYGDDLLRANTSDGTVDLSGLPIDEPIIALAEADGYHTRTAVITSIYEQDSLYLLNSSLDSYQLVFDITDPTGAYPRSDTILEVQRDIQLNGTTEWRTVAGDVFGAQGVTTDLEAGERYRLIVRNLETGERATLGSFTPIASQTITLEPESATVDVGLEDNVSIGYAASRSSSGDAIIVEYADPDQTTSQLTFMIHERYNESNVLLQNQSFSDLGNLTYSEPLNASAQNQSWVVDFYWTNTDGDSSQAQVVIGQGPRDGLIPSNLDTVYRASIGVAVLLITALLFSQLNVGVGAVTTSLVGGLLWYLGFLSTVTTGPAVVLAIGMSGLLYYNSGGGVT